MVSQGMTMMTLERRSPLGTAALGLTYSFFGDGRPFLCPLLRMRPGMTLRMTRVSPDCV